MSVEDELLLAAEVSCVPWVVEELGLEDAVRVLTELAAEVLLPEVEAAAAALVPAALTALQHALENNKEPRIAYQVLTDTGVIPSADERLSTLTQPPRSLSDEAREALLESLSEKDKMLFRALKMFQEKAEVFGMRPDSIIPSDPPRVGPAEANNGNEGD